MVIPIVAYLWMNDVGVWGEAPFPMHESIKDDDDADVVDCDQMMLVL